MLNCVLCLELSPANLRYPPTPPPPPPQIPTTPTTPLHAPTHPPINPKIVWSDEYLPSKPLSCLGLYSSVRWPNPHQKTPAPSLSLSPSALSLSLALFLLSLFLSFSIAPLLFLGLSVSLSPVCVAAAHSGSHLVFLFWLYMSPRTHVLSHLFSCSTPVLPPSLSRSCSYANRSTAHTHVHMHTHIHTHTRGIFFSKRSLSLFPSC